MPRVSVIIPCYNLGKYLPEAVDSVLSQTYRDFEVIIVDDASTDLATRQLLATYLLPKVRIVYNSHNMGVAAARNEGIGVAKGEFVLPLDADDVIAESYLEKAIALFDLRPDIGIVYSNAEFVGEKSGLWELPPFSIDRMLTENLVFSAALFRRSDWKRSGGYCSSMTSGWEDWDFWLTLLSLGVQVGKLSDTLFKYRIRIDSRDRSISRFNKLVLLLGIVFRHRRLYVSYPSSVFKLLYRVSVSTYGS